MELLERKGRGIRLKQLISVAVYTKTVKDIIGCMRGQMYGVNGG